MKKSKFVKYTLVMLCVSWAKMAFAAPSTAQFMNAMTVCAAGVQVNIDANLQGSLTSIYNEGVTKGKAGITIFTEMQKMMSHGEMYSSYLGCLKTMMDMK